MLAALAVAALFALVDAQSQCAPATIGQVTRDVRTLPDVQLNDHSRDYDITLPNNACAPKRQVGTTITACDYDVPPTPSLQSLLSGHLHRNGNLLGPAVVHIAVYCA